MIRSDIEEDKLRQVRKVKEMSMSISNEVNANIALVWACALNYIPAVVYLINVEKVDVNNTVFLGYKTPLMFAAANGHERVVQFLLDAGANPNLVDVHGVSALTKAATKGSLPCVDLLLAKSAIIDNKCINAAEIHKHPHVSMRLLGRAPDQVSEIKGKSHGSAHKFFKKLNPFNHSFIKAKSESSHRLR